MNVEWKKLNQNIVLSKSPSLESTCMLVGCMLLMWIWLIPSGFFCLLYHISAFNKRISLQVCSILVLQHLKVRSVGPDVAVPNDSFAKEKVQEMQDILHPDAWSCACLVGVFSRLNSNGWCGMIVGVPNFSGALLLQGCTRWECSPDKGYQPRGSHFSWPTKPRGDEWGEGGKTDQIGMPFWWEKWGTLFFIFRGMSNCLDTHLLD